MHRTRSCCRNRRCAGGVHPVNVRLARLHDGGGWSVPGLSKRAGTRVPAHTRYVIDSIIGPEPLVAQSATHIEPAGWPARRRRSRSHVRSRDGAQGEHKLVLSIHGRLIRAHEPRDARIQRHERRLDQNVNFLLQPRKARNAGARIRLMHDSSRIALGGRGVPT